MTKELMLMLPFCFALSFIFFARTGSPHSMTFPKASFSCAHLASEIAARILPGGCDTLVARALPSRSSLRLE